MTIAQAKEYFNRQNESRWFVAPVTNEEIEKTLMQAYEVGVHDASSSSPFAPETYFADQGRMADYTLGFMEIQPNNVVAIAFWNDLATPEPSIEDDTPQTVAVWW